MVRFNDVDEWKTNSTENDLINDWPLSIKKFAFLFIHIT